MRSKNLLSLAYLLILPIVIIWVFGIMGTLGDGATSYNKIIRQEYRYILAVFQLLCIIQWIRLEMKEKGSKGLLSAVAIAVIPLAFSSYCIYEIVRAVKYIPIRVFEISAIGLLFFYWSICYDSSKRRLYQAIALGCIAFIISRLFFVQLPKAIPVQSDGSRIFLFLIVNALSAITAGLTYGFVRNQDDRKSAFIIGALIILNQTFNEGVKITSPLFLLLYVLPILTFIFLGAMTSIKFLRPKATANPSI
ncbi:MAG: hypothetical protein OEW04_01550 [Nitrospirota bacterium]|nr:hypothetical protein [Nitrospirota bacterium]